MPTSDRPAVLFEIAELLVMFGCFGVINDKNNNNEYGEVAGFYVRPDALFSCILHCKQST